MAQIDSTHHREVVFYAWLGLATFHEQPHHIFQHCHPYRAPHTQHTNAHVRTYLKITTEYYIDDLGLRRRMCLDPSMKGIEFACIDITNLPRLLPWNNPLTLVEKRR
jgi:hypothetical protein